MSKTIICRCEDVTLTEIRDAIRQGKADIESLKRYLAVGTGPCQAKNCLLELARMLIEEGKATPETIQPIRSRPPCHMASLELFAGREEGGEK